jgi:hypothetical protein
MTGFDLAVTVGVITVVLSAIRTVLAFVRTEAALETAHATEDEDTKAAKQRQHRDRIPVWLRKGNTDE